MNHAEKAKQLQEERLERERQEKERQAREQEEAAAKKRKMAEVAKQKTEELLPLFKQFSGFKVHNGHVTLEAEVRYQEGSAFACLRAGSVGMSALHECQPLTVMLSGHYDAEADRYELNRYEARPRVAGSHTVVGKYKTADELMDAVSVEVSKL